MPGESNSADTSHDIVVTAGKRQQTLVDVPSSVSVITGAELERDQARTFQDFLKHVPGLQVNESAPGAARLTIRGLNTGGTASTVSVYADESPFGSSSGLANGAILAGDFDTFDIARIEVLRGPQGTLYGASSLGGVLKYVTNAPDPGKLDVRVRAGVETVKDGGAGYLGNAMVNLPLTSTLAARVSGFYRREGGFIDSIGTAGSQIAQNINGHRVYGGRASLLWTPGEHTSIRLTALLQNIQSNAPAVVESNPNTLQPLYGRRSQSIYVTPFGDVDYRLYNGTVNFNLGFADLTSVSSYSTQRQSGRTDATFTLSPFVAAYAPFFNPSAVRNQVYGGSNVNLEKFTQEVRLSSSESNLVDWIVGAFYTHEDALIHQKYVPVVPGTLTEISPFPDLVTADLASSFEEVAIFANATVHLGDHFDIDLGGRRSHNRQRADQLITGLFAPPSPGRLSQASSENVFTYSVAPKFKWNNHVSIYGRVAKGYRPGGPNVLAPGAPPGSESYDADTVINYEVGVKAETADRKFSIEVAGFYIDWRDIQLINAVSTPQGNITFNANGGRAQSEGVEFVVSARPAPGFQVSINGAYNHAFLKDPVPLLGGRSGDDLPYTPKYTVSLNGDYNWRLSDGVRASIGGSLRSVSKSMSGFSQVVGYQRVVPAREVVDLHAGLDFSRFQLAVYATNLNNADEALSVGAPGNYPAGAATTGVMRPRTLGLSLTAGF